MVSFYENDPVLIWINIEILKTLIPFQIYDLKTARDKAEGITGKLKL